MTKVLLSCVGEQRQITLIGMPAQVAAAESQISGIIEMNTGTGLPGVVSMPTGGGNGMMPVASGTRNHSLGKFELINTHSHAHKYLRNSLGVTWCSSLFDFSFLLFLCIFIFIRVSTTWTRSIQWWWVRQSAARWLRYGATTRWVRHGTATGRVRATATTLDAAAAATTNANATNATTEGCRWSYGCR